MNALPTTLAESYAPQGSTPAEKLLEYPFARPTHSYFTDGETVTQLPETYDAFAQAADEYLGAHNVPLMSERIPVVAYGANASPYKLTEKMGGKFTPDAVRAELQIVPNLRAELRDTAIAWHGKPGQNGSIFAELYKGDDTKGVVSDCFVQFLTQEQVALLHATEGITYHFSPVAVTAGEDAQELTAYAYVAGHSQVLLENGKPVLVESLTRTSGESVTKSAREAVAGILQAVGDPSGPEEFVANAPATLAEKKVRQEQVRVKLAEAGMSTSFSYPAEGHIGRADFNMPQEFITVGNKELPLIQTMEQRLERMRPAGGVKPTADLLHIIRRRAHDERAQQIAENDKITG